MQAEGQPRSDAGSTAHPGTHAAAIADHAPPHTEPAAAASLLPAIVAGFLAVLVSFSGPLAIFYQAAEAGQVSATMFASWVWGISIGAGVAGIYLSWRLKAPVITAWSAPGTALLITLFPGLSVNEAVGAYLVAATILLAIGMSGWMERVSGWVPPGVASGMMAGILVPFGMNAFKGVATMPLLVLGMIGAYLVFKRSSPRYCVALLLASGTLIAWLSGATRFTGLDLQFVVPVFIEPAWSWSAIFSLALPLVLVTLTGQYLPGMTVLKQSGYDTPVRPVIVTSSLASLAVAFTGGITIAIAAITAAMCTGREAHEDPRRRYVAGLANGAFYLLAGLFGGSIVMLFAALPKELVAALAGLALLGPILANLGAMLAAQDHREASLITFVATASGMSFLGLGAAFWGVVIGIAACRILHGPAAGRAADKQAKT
ncbi:benzoate/H(+) symporter BenE family transporter [Massilia consociata]|uniref:Benzoate/H(+) symporter BenE family transporter n=1 Tax=Massilia consociata TaxID=760117 RepID=A0ABV6FGU0_9BURK